LLKQNNQLKYIVVVVLTDDFYCFSNSNFSKAQIARSLMMVINLLNAKLNPICHLLALLGAHHILHFGRIRVKPKHVGAFLMQILIFLLKQNSCKLVGK